MGVKLVFADRALLEEADSVSYEVSGTAGGYLIVKLFDGKGNVVSTHASVRSVWK